MSKTKPIPIAAAKAISKDYGYDQIVILARKHGDDGLSCAATYGKTKADCDVAGKIGEKFIRLENGQPIVWDGAMAFAKRAICKSQQHG